LKFLDICGGVIVPLAAQELTKFRCRLSICDRFHSQFAEGTRRRDPLTVVRLWEPKRAVWAVAVYRQFEPPARRARVIYGRQ
jgi:hypothetical protein